MKFVKENKKQAKEQASKVTQATVLATQESAKQKSADAQQVQSPILLIFTGVIGSILTGILLYGIMYVKKRFFTHPGAETKTPTAGKVRDTELKGRKSDYAEEKGDNQSSFGELPK
jgi:hypothetical protein